MSEATTVNKEISFSFRKNKDTGEQRQGLELTAPFPNQEGVATLLMSEDPKVSSFIVDLVEDALKGYVRSLVDSDLNFSQATLDALVADGKFNIETLANLPRSERNTLTKEQLEDFAKDYVSVMPGITGKPIESAQSAAGLMLERFKRVAGDNKILSVLKDRLGQFIEGADAEVVAKHERVLTYLTSKLEELLALELSAEAL